VVTLCDPIRQVTSRSSKTSSRRELYSALTLTLTLTRKIRLRVRGIDVTAKQLCDCIKNNVTLYLLTFCNAIHGLHSD